MSSTPDQLPTLSAILPSWDTYDSVRATLAHLRRQTIVSQIEMVFVCRTAANFALQSHELTQFYSYQIVEIGEIDSRARAFAEGVMAARAPFTVFCEDHCFPVPEWAEALILRHKSGNYAAVGPMFANANPENSLSDADLLIAYAPWLQGLPGGEHHYVPGHNSCYRREVLLAEQPRLAHELEAEYVLHTRYVTEGIKLYVEPRARVYHMNFATWNGALGASYLSGKVFGANRAQTWPITRRFIFAMACFIVPLLRLWRIISLARQAGWATSKILKTLPALLAYLIISAIGEWAGNLLGKHSRTPSLVYYEFHRHRYSPALKDQDLESTLKFT